MNSKQRRSFRRSHPEAMDLLRIKLSLNPMYPWPRWANPIEPFSWREFDKWTRLGNLTSTVTPPTLTGISVKSIIYDDIQA